MGDNTTAVASADAPSALLLLRLDSMAGATTAATSTSGFNSHWPAPASVVQDHGEVLALRSVRGVRGDAQEVVLHCLAAATFCLVALDIASSCPAAAAAAPAPAAAAILADPPVGEPTAPGLPPRSLSLSRAAASGASSVRNPCAGLAGEAGCHVGGGAGSDQQRRAGAIGPAGGWVACQGGLPAVVPPQRDLRIWWLR
jgi:hypothetical protein